MADLVLGAGGAAAEAYTIDQSLRFNELGYLVRTPTVNGDKGKWTLSVWVKICDLPASGGQLVLGTDGSVAAGGWIRFNNQSMNVELAQNSWNTTAVFRDPSAWYHAVWAYDKDQAAATDQMKMYIFVHLIG